MKVAILGAGGMGLTVLRHLQDCEAVTAITAFDLRASQLADLRTKYDIDVTDNLDDILGDSQIECVFITASNDAHAALTIASLKARKAVMCEKPMATTLEDARMMVQCAEETRGFLQIGFELRYSRLYATIKSWIDEGLLGEIVNIHCIYMASAWPQNTWRANGAGGGMFGEKLSHYVDLPRWWVGSPIEEIHAVSAPNAIPYYQVRDNYHATYRFCNGAVGNLTFMMAPAATFQGDPLQCVTDQQIGDGHELRFIVQGTRGAAQSDVFARTLKRWTFSNSADKFISNWVETLTWSQDEDHFWYHNTYDQTHDIIRRVAEGMPPKIAPRDAYETMKVCFAGEQSVDTRQTVKMSE